MLPFKILYADRWVPVALPGYGTGSGLDRFDRAEMNAPAAELTVVLPDGSTLNNFNIFNRADGRTYPA
jgi:hypothetical protein